MNEDQAKKQALRNHRKKVIRDTTTLTSEMKNSTDQEPKKDPQVIKGEKPDLGENLMSWQAPEFIYYEKSRRWYVVAVLIFAALIAYAIYERSFVMAITFVIAGGIFYYFAQKKPAQLDIVVTDAGIKYHDRFFPYEDLNGFWITYEPPDLKILTFSTRFLMVPKLSIILTQQDPVELRKILIEELPEDKKLEENAVDAFSRRISF
jgi:hypothetical protein